MKAMVAKKYGPPEILKLQEIEKPVPGETEVLIQVKAAAVNAYDWHMLRAKPFLVRFMGGGLFRPKKKILGSDVAGVVAALGPGVTDFKVGDEVFGEISGSNAGGFAEYVCAAQQYLALKPAGVSFEAAAACPMAGLTALTGLRTYGKIRKGQQVLINGASGGVGSFAVQIAKAFDTEVTAVCSTSKLEMVKSIGADYAIDYTREDFTRNGRQYDIILTANGYHPLKAYLRALKPGGNFVLSGETMQTLFQISLRRRAIEKREHKKLHWFVTNTNREDLLFLQDLLRQGKIKPVIDKCYPLDELPAAIHYVDKGHARGKAVIQVHAG